MSASDAEFPVQRRALIPDSRRVERCLRLPEFGPRLFFFTGGSALRDTSRVLKRYTHNSIHLITPFDSGGSSAVLREAFSILGVGDLRNRLMALADESALSEPHVRALFSHRLPMGEAAEELRAQLDGIMHGEHPLVRAIDKPLRAIVLTHLQEFAKRMPSDFDLRGANIGNLILAGGYLVNQRDIEAVLYMFSELVNLRGTVRPTVTDDAHLVAIHENGERTVGQHRIGKEESLPRGRIEGLELTTALIDGVPIEVDADEFSLRLIGMADVIVFPMGSFFGSVLANLVPRGVGRAVFESSSPRVYVPNSGLDLEMRGYTVSQCVSKIAEFVSKDVGEELKPSQVLDFVLIDSKGLEYATPLDLEELHELGVQVVDTSFNGVDPGRHDPLKLTEALLSLA